MPELHYDIVDHVLNSGDFDAAELAAIARLSSSWLAPCRQLLYGVISFKAGWSLRRLRLFLQTLQLTQLGHLTTVLLFGPDSAADGLDDLSQRDIVLDLLKRLPNITRL